MCESSTLTPPLTRTRCPPPVTESMRRRKNELMNRGYARWSTRHLLHLFFWSQEEWGERQPVSINTWPPCLLRSGITHTAPHGIWWLRCRLTSLICSTIQALRGARSSRGQATHPPAAIDLAITETHITPDFNLFVTSKFSFCFVYTISLTLHFSLFVSLYHVQCMCVKRREKNFFWDCPLLSQLTSNFHERRYSEQQVG